MNLNELACEMVGDGKTPNMFFVSYKGEAITATRNFDLAYRQWQACPVRQESALEDRLFGTIASTEPREDGSKKLVTHDDSDMFLKMYPETRSVCA